GINKSDTKQVSINDILEPVLVLLEGRFQRGVTTIALESNIPEQGQIPSINCYPKDLSQVLLGILENAADAIEKEVRSPDSRHFEQRSPKIEISAYFINRDQNPCVEIVISNNGPAIPLHIQEKIFDPFFTTKDVGEGTGIGLSVAYQTIAYQHQGKVWCESNRDHTSFYIQLPLDRERQRIRSLNAAVVANSKVSSESAVNKNNRAGKDDFKKPNNSPTY
ncbi:MAG: HAMP domain-containing sensor histidine kinase, partial [Cyanobacteria bacterium P01_F01_bin.153]